MGHSAETWPFIVADLEGAFWSIVYAKTSAVIEARMMTLRLEGKTWASVRRVLEHEFRLP